MPIYLRQSTASQEIPLGYFLDSTDGNTEETGLTIANTDIKVWKTGATTLASKNSGGATHISNGVYYTVLDATDTNTIGPLVVFIHVAGALAIKVECVVLDEAVYDVLFCTVALTTITGAVGSVTGAVGSVTTVSDKTGYSLSATGLDAIAATATGMVEIAKAIWNRARSSHVTAGTFGEGAASVQGNVTGSVASVTGAVGSVTGNVGGNVTGSAGSVTGAVGSVIGNVGGNVTGTVGSVVTKTGYELSSTGVNAVADGVLDRPIAEPTAVFSWASATLRGIMQHIGALSRNKITQSTTLQTLRNDADSGNIATAGTTDTAGVTTRDEWA